MNANRMGWGLVVVAGALALSAGCAHKREAYYPPEPGVRVRAPFVDVNVPTGPRGVVVPPGGAGYGADQFAEPELDLD